MHDVGCGTRFRVDAETTAKRWKTVQRGAAEDVLLSGLGGRLGRLWLRQRGEQISAGKLVQPEGFQVLVRLAADA
jgi:hypothetical protein